MSFFSRNTRTSNRRSGKENRLRLEVLESRLLLSIDGLSGSILPANTVQTVEIGPAISRDVLVMPQEMQQQQTDPSAERSGSINPLDVITYSTLANGMPILDSYPNNPSHATIFLDFDGDPQLFFNNGTESAKPYSEDSDPTTFNAAEQATIVECWRQTAAYYAMFDITVTTVLPDVSITPTAWNVLTPTEGNGWSWVGVFPNGSAQSFENSYFAQSRESGIAHEVGHNFGNWHTSNYDDLGNKTAEYSSGLYAAAPSPLQGPIMGVDFAGVIHKWTNWHSSGSVDSYQDDMKIIADQIVQHAPSGYTGDGYRPDDFGGIAGSISNATALAVSGVTQVVTGIIERLSDVDTFSFTSTGGTYSITAGRDAPSAVDLRLSIYDSAGTLLATEDGDPRALPYTMVNDQEFALNLAAGTYYAVVECHGNYGDQGQYNLRVDPLPAAWKSTDVGLPGVPGYVSYNAASSTYTVAGSGDDIWNSSDSFQYLYQTLSGNGSITVRINSMDNTSAWAKSGIMFRESLAANSKDAYFVMTPSNGAQWSARTTAGDTPSAFTPNTGANFSATWLRITRSGNNFTAYKSSNGSSWVQFGSPLTVSMNSTIYVGLVSSAVNNSSTNAATFTNVTLTGTLNPGPSLNALPAPGSLAVTGKTASGINLSWSNVGGESGYSIERSSDNITFAQIGTTAADVVTYADSGLADYQRYFYRVRAQTSDGKVSTPSNVVNEITRAGAVSNLRIVSYTPTELVLDWTEASGETGYRVERSPNGTSSWTTIGTPGKNVTTVNSTGLTTNTQYYYRVVTLDGSGDAAISAVVSRYTRLNAVTGLTFTSKASNQISLSWTALNTATSYRVERSTDNSTFTVLASNVSVTNYSDTSVTALGEYYYRVIGMNANIESVTSGVIFAAAPAAAALPNSWTSQDIGAVGGTGAAGYSGSTFTVVASGADIWGSADEFRYTYQPMVGDGWIIAKVASLESTDGWAKSGVMIRESLAAGARYAATFVTPDNGLNFHYRTSTNGGSTNVGGAAVKAPYYVKITRSGNTFTSEVSSDGSTWTTLGTTTISMGSNVYVGLALTSHNDGLLNTATFSNVQTNNAAPTITTAAKATPATVTGTTTALTVVANDDHGESNLTYTWTATTLPVGAAQPTYSANGTNAAKNATATFSKVGSYVFQVTVTDSGGLTVSSSLVNVTVNQTLTGITVSPSSVILPVGGHQQFAATALDQFGNAMSTQPTFTWTATAGTVPGGYYTAGSSSATVTAKSGLISGTANVTVDTHVPTVATEAVAMPTPVVGTSTALSVLGADIEGEANLNYTWTATVFPDGAAPTYSLNGTNAAKNTTATFSKAGDYTFQVTIADAVGLSITSTVVVTVNQTVTSIAVSPASVSLPPGSTQQFAAAAKDQFGNDIISPPAFSWTATAGTIDANGLFTAPLTTTTITIQASLGTVISNAATATTANAAPTIVTTVTANPNPVTGTTADLSVLGADDWGEANLTYTWISLNTPVGGLPPIFTVNDSNAAKNTTVIFSISGIYRLRATITDAAGLSTASFAFLTVNKTLTSIVVTPANVDLPTDGTQQFSAAAFDQFGKAMTVGFTWNATAGSIDSSGLYTAPSSPTTATVQATNGSVVGTCNVAVNAINNPPSNLLLSNASIAENATGVTIGTLSTVDPDANETFTYSLENDPTGKFEIVGDALKLKDGQSLDFEATPTIDLLLRTTDSGGLYFEKTFTIAVVNQPEVPTDILLTSTTIAENQAAATIGTLSSADPDQGETFTYSLENDPTGKFEIVGDALKLKDGQSLDFEATPTIDLLLRTTDSGGLYLEKTFTITATDLPEVLTVGTGDWTVARLTLKRDADGKLHVYETDTTTDAVPPHNPAMVLGIDVTGRTTADELTVVSVDASIPTLTVNGGTLRLGADDALFTGTNVTVNGGVLDFNGHTSPMGNLTLTGGAEARVPTINNTTTTIASGTLTASSIVSNTLTIGSAPENANVSVQAAEEVKTVVHNATLPLPTNEIIPVSSVGDVKPNLVSVASAPITAGTRSDQEQSTIREKTATEPVEYLALPQESAPVLPAVLLFKPRVEIVSAGTYLSIPATSVSQPISNYSFRSTEMLVREPSLSVLDNRSTIDQLFQPISNDLPFVGFQSGNNSEKAITRPIGVEQEESVSVERVEKASLASIKGDSTSKFTALQFAIQAYEEYSSADQMDFDSLEKTHSHASREPFEKAVDAIFAED
jgi:fibronectin type 3 domain-containing protein